MTGLEDRQSLSQDIGVAHAAGARLHMACEIAGIDVRTLQCWRRCRSASIRRRGGGFVMGDAER